ncbi:MAG: carbohydrate kinase [Phaeodactylibacter sp.]|nr:carbohydrate kinase [Phaeodactylibacter sp.]
MPKPAIVCFGEVLWDLLPSGKIAGGAPMNVAYHANQFGMQSKMISSIGDDELGSELKRFLENKGVSTEFIQTDKAFPTGVVNVMLDAGGSPSYEIVSPVAWDNIQLDDAVMASVKTADALVFGSLACRTEQNRQALFEYMDVAKLRVFDVNLRAPFYARPLIGSLLARADIVKMNDEELALIAGWLGATGAVRAQMEYIRDEYGLSLFIMTRGKDGAVCLDGGGFYEHPGFPVTVKDTIGSGDSFLAAFLSKHLTGAPPSDCLVFAGAVGALVATRAGGTPEISPEEVQAFIQSKSV